MAARHRMKQMLTVNIDAMGKGLSELKGAFQSYPEAKLGIDLGSQEIKVIQPSGDIVKLKADKIDGYTALLGNDTPETEFLRLSQQVRASLKDVLKHEIPDFQDDWMDQSFVQRGGVSTRYNPGDGQHLGIYDEDPVLASAQRGACVPQKDWVALANSTDRRVCVGAPAATAGDIKRKENLLVYQAKEHKSYALKDLVAATDQELSPKDMQAKVVENVMAFHQNSLDNPTSDLQQFYDSIHDVCENAKDAKSLKKNIETQVKNVHLGPFHTHMATRGFKTLFPNKRTTKNLLEISCPGSSNPGWVTVRQSRITGKVRVTSKVFSSTEGKAFIKEKLKDTTSLVENADMASLLKEGHPLMTTTTHPQGSPTYDLHVMNANHLFAVQGLSYAKARLGKVSYEHNAEAKTLNKMLDRLLESEHHTIDVDSKRDELHRMMHQNASFKRDHKYACIQINQYLDHVAQLRSYQHGQTVTPLMKKGLGKKAHGITISRRFRQVLKQDAKQPRQRGQAGWVRRKAPIKSAPVNTATNITKAQLEQDAEQAKRTLQEKTVGYNRYRQTTEGVLASATTMKANQTLLNALQSLVGQTYDRVGIQQVRTLLDSTMQTIQTATAGDKVAKGAIDRLLSLAEETQKAAEHSKQAAKALDDYQPVQSGSFNDYLVKKNATLPTVYGGGDNANTNDPNKQRPHN